MSKLKITQDDQNLINDGLKDWINVNSETIQNHVKHLRVLFIQGKVKDIQKRVCFDIFRAYGNFLKYNGINSYDQFYDNVYKYANDDNIYSFLKTIVPYKQFFKLTKGV